MIERGENMKNALKMEWGLLRKRKVLLYVLIAVLLTTLLYQYGYYSKEVDGFQIGGFIETFFITDGNKGLFYNYFLIFLPIIASVFYSWVSSDDRKCIANIDVRTKKEYVLYARIIMNFIVGFIFCFSLLISISIVTYLIVRNKVGTYNCLTFQQYELSLVVKYGLKNDVLNTTMGGLFFENPYLYYFLYFIIWSVYSGIQAVIGCLISYFTNKKIVSVIAPFAFNFIILMAFVELVLPRPYKYYTVLTVLAPFARVLDASVIPFIWIGYIVIAVVLMIIGVKYICKDDYLYGKS